MNNRYIWVDYAKAIGIILVVYGHVARGVLNAGIPMDEGLFNLIDSIIYTFHMPLFFFLSGLFFYGSLQKRGVQGLLGSKIDTIVYPYLLWSILQGLIEAYLSSYTTGSVTYQEVFALLWAPRVQFWFLYALFMVFVVAAVIFHKLPKQYTPAIFMISMLVYIFQDELLGAFHLNYLTKHFVFFTLGMLLNQWSESKYLNAKGLLPITALGFIVSQYVFHMVLGLTFNDKGLPLLIVTLTAIFFIFFLSKHLANKVLASWLIPIGAASMGIYLMHILAASGARIVLKSVGDIQVASVHLAVGLLVGIVAPLLMLYLIKKLKVPFVFHMPISHFLSSAHQKIFTKR